MGWEDSPGVGNGNPLQYSCLGNPMDRGAWQLQPIGLQRVRHDRVHTVTFSTVICRNEQSSGLGGLSLAVPYHSHMQLSFRTSSPALSSDVQLLGMSVWLLLSRSLPPHWLRLNMTLSPPQRVSCGRPWAVKCGFSWAPLTLVPWAGSLLWFPLGDSVCPSLRDCVFLLSLPPPSSRFQMEQCE